MKASAAKEKTTNPTEPFIEVTDTMLKNYEQAMHTGLKLQEEASRWWNSVLRQPSVGPDWQKHWSSTTRAANQFGPLAEKRLEDVCTLVEKNSRCVAELVQKALEAAQTTTMSEAQTKWMDFWSASVGAFKSNTEALTQLGARSLDSWVEFVRKNGETVEAAGAKAA